MKKIKLLILGGNRLNIPSIEEVRDNGFEVWLADGNPNAAGFDVADHKIVANISDSVEVFNKIKGIKVDGIVAMAEAGVRTVAILCEKLGLSSISVSAAFNATSKLAMRKLWANTGYSTGFSSAKNIDEAKAAISYLGGYPLVFKPDESFGGSRGVSVVKEDNQFLQAFKFAQNASRNQIVVIEKCISGDEYSCEVLIYRGKHSILAIGQKVKSPLPFRVDLSVRYEPDFSDEENKEINTMCSTAIDRLGIRQGVAHIEFAKTNSGFQLFELGARCGGGHTPIIAKHVSGVSEFLEYCRISCGMSPKHFVPEKHWGAEYRFLVFPEGIVHEVLVPRELRKEKNLIDLVVDIKPGEKIFPLNTTSDRSGCIVTKGVTRLEAVNNAERFCQKIKVIYENGRIENPMFV